MALLEGQWRLTYGAFGRYPAGDFLFGTLATGFDLMEPPEIVLGEVEAGDAPLALESGVRHGIDYEGAGTVTFEVNVDTAGLAADDRYRANLDALGRMREAWKAEAVRDRSGVVATLETVNGGETRFLYGRPRRFAPAKSRLTRKGHTPVLCDFVVSDGRFYGGPEQTRRIASAVAPSGGFKTPFLSPFTTVQFASNLSDLIVTGQAPTWPVITIKGPISQPAVSIGRLWTLSLNMTLDASESVTIDTRPWARTMTRTGGGSVSGLVGRGSPRMTDMLLNPGVHEVVLGGKDSTGQSYVEIRHRPAYGWL